MSFPDLKIVPHNIYIFRGAQFSGARQPGRLNFYNGSQNLYFLSMEFGSCLLSGTCNFEVASRFSEILRTPAFFYTVLLQIGG